MSYVTYDSSRSPWEGLDWLEPSGEEKIIFRRYGVPSRTINEISIDIKDVGVLGDIEADIVVLREEISSETDDVDREIWVRIGYVIVVGLAIFLIGIGFRFIYPGPVPLAVAAIGMAFVAMALWRGGKLEQA
jgi:hypothetical protein